MKQECPYCHRVITVDDKGKFVSHEWVPGNLASLEQCPASGTVAPQK